MKTFSPERLKKAIGPMSVQTFAQRCEVTRATIYNLLNGKYEPRANLLFKIAENAGVKMEYLFQGGE